MGYLVSAGGNMMPLFTSRGTCHLLFHSVHYIVHFDIDFFI